VFSIRQSERQYTEIRQCRRGDASGMQLVFGICTSDPAMVAEVDRLLDNYNYAETARILNEKGFRTGDGLPVASIRHEEPTPRAACLLLLRWNLHEVVGIAEVSGLKQRICHGVRMRIEPTVPPQSIPLGSLSRVVGHLPISPRSRLFTCKLMRKHTLNSPPWSLRARASNSRPASG